MGNLLIFTSISMQLVLLEASWNLTYDLTKGENKLPS